MQILCLGNVRQLLLFQGTVQTTSVHTAGQSSFDDNTNVHAIIICLLNARKLRLQVSPAHATFHVYLSSVPDYTIFEVLCGRRKELQKISFPREWLGEAPRQI